MVVSLIIPTLNRPKSLCSCFKSIAAADYPPEEIIIVDQSDFRETEEVINEWRTALLERGVKTVFYIKTEVKSLTSSRNLGLRNSKGEVVVFCDDDVEFQKDNFVFMRKYFEDKGSALLGAFNSLDQKTMHSPYGYFFDLKEVHLSGKGYVTKSCLGRLPKKKQGYISTEWAMGYCFAIRRKFAVDNNIFFDEKMGGYAFNEDLDFTSLYCKKAKAMGMHCVYHQQFAVKHNESKEYRIPSPLFYLSWIGNRYYILKKWGRRNFMPFYSSICGLSLLLFLKDKKKFAVLREAKKAFKRHKRAVSVGDLRYSQWIKK